MKSYIIKTLNTSWLGRGETIAEGVQDAFRQIIDRCHNDDKNNVPSKEKLQIGLTFSVRLEGEPESKAIGGYNTIGMLKTVGELDDLSGWLLEEGIKRNGYRE